MLYVAIAATALSGLSIVLNRIINSALAERIGLFPSTLYNYITGLIVSIIFVLISGESTMISSLNPGTAPFWAYLGGFTGVIVIVLSSYLTPKISAFYLTLLLFVGQLFTGMLIDFFNAGSFSLPKLIGGIFVLAGLTYNLVLDKKKDAMQASNE